MAPAPAARIKRLVLMASSVSDAAHHQQHEAEGPARRITPAAAMGPGGNCSSQHQDNDDQQNHSKTHGVFSFQARSSSATGCSCSMNSEATLTVTMIGIASSRPQTPHSQPQNS